MHCEFLYREHRKPRWISTLNQKHLFVKHLLDHNLYIEYIYLFGRQNSGIKSKIQQNISLGSIKEFAEEKSEEVEAHRQ